MDDVGSGTGSDFDDLPAMPRPPEMVQNRENKYISSVTSTTSPGMAGAGAFRFQHENDNNNNKSSFENEQEYYRDNVGQQYYDENIAAGSSAVPMQRAPLQPREQYTFGQAPATISRAAAENANPFLVDDYDGEASGAYGSDPHAVGQYGNQGYDDYVAYSPPQTHHNAGAHASTHYANKSVDETDAYGGI